MITERILDFIRRPQEADFLPLAIAAHAFQSRSIEALRNLDPGDRGEPRPVSSWQDIPLVPTLAYRTIKLAAAPAIEVFSSSGTTDENTATHYHPFPALYRAVIEATFPQACLPTRQRASILSLIPSREEAPHSSLAFMVDHLAARYGDETSRNAWTERGLKLSTARSWLAARQRDRRAAILLTTSLALLQLLEGLERLGLRFRLPAGTMLFDTGGTKGRRQEIERQDLCRMADARLGLEQAAIVREYGMTELTSHFYSSPLRGDKQDVFVPPPWTRVRILDPLTLAERPQGEPGLIAVFDLANVGSALHLLTEDIGMADGGGFRLVGRASGAQLRGCSLLAEEFGSS